MKLTDKRLCIWELATTSLSAMPSFFTVKKLSLIMLIVLSYALLEIVDNISKYPCLSTTLTYVQAGRMYLHLVFSFNHQSQLNNLILHSAHLQFSLHLKARLNIRHVQPFLYKFDDDLRKIQAPPEKCSLPISICEHFVRMLCLFYSLMLYLVYNFKRLIYRNQHIV